MGFTCNLLSCTDQPLPLNMKLVILFALLAVAAAAPQQAVLRSSEARMNPDGSYKFSYEIDDGTRVVESGEQKQITVVDSGTVSRGQYTLAKVCDTPLTGLPMKTDSSPKEIIYPEHKDLTA